MLDKMVTNEIGTHEIIPNDDSKSRSAGSRRGCIFGCLIPIILVVICCSLPVLINAAQVFSNQLKWQSAHIESYIFSIGYAGLNPHYVDSVHKISVRNGKVETVKPATSSYDENLFHLTVDYLFSSAYSCFVICEVEYDAKYGYPKSIGGGFPGADGEWIIVVDFELLPD